MEIVTNDSEPYLSIDLKYLHCDVLQIDDVKIPRGCLALDGLIYRGLSATHDIIAQWLKAQHSDLWLKELSNGKRHNLPPSELFFPPQPYQLAATVLERQGLEELAADVVAEERDLERRILQAQTCYFFAFLHDRRFYKRVWIRIDRLLLRHGFALGRAMACLALLWFLGALIFLWADIQHCMVPTQEVAWHDFPQNQGRRNPDDGWSRYYPHFRPFVYSLDLCIPFMDFNQANYWEPNPDWMPEPNSSASRVARIWQWVRHVLFYHHNIISIIPQPPRTSQQEWAGVVSYLYLPVHILTGWFLSTVTVIGFTRRLRHRQMELPGSE